MVPLVGTEEEMVRLREMIVQVVERVQTEEEVQLGILIGTMIEVPRAALVADSIAAHADFFSFGTNDLTQMTYGYSRDDVGRFLPQYIESRSSTTTPSRRIDEEGVGQLVRLACERGRETRPDLHLGDLRRARRRSALDRLLRARRPRLRLLLPLPGADRPPGRGAGQPGAAGQGGSRGKPEKASRQALGLGR